MTRDRVLVVGDDYYASLAAVRGLRSGGYEPWFASAVAGTLAARSRAVAGAIRVPLPSDGAAAFVDAVAAEARRLGVAAVLPGTEASLAALAGRRDRFDAALGAPSPLLLRRVTDKAALAAAARAAGLASPAAVLLGEAATVAFPAIVKPVQSTMHSGSRTRDLPPARRVESVEELEALRRELPAAPFVVQPFLEGGLGALAGVAWNGEIVCASQQLARRIYPLGAGASSFAETIALDRDLLARVASLLASVGWSGLWELQFIAAEDDWYLIDFNPRFYGSLALAIAAGLNLPAIWTDLLLGRRPRIGAYRPGTRYRAEVRDVRAVLAGLPHTLRDAWPHRHTTHAVFALRDPLPFLELGLRPVRRVLGRGGGKQLETT